MTFFKQNFGSALQQFLLAVLILSGLLIVQPWSMQVYQVGLVLLIAAALLEVGAGNIPPGAKLRQSLTLLAVALLVVALVFALGIFLVPYLVGLGG